MRETIAIAAISNLGQGGRIFASLRANKSVWDIVERVADLFGFTAKLEQPAKSLSQGDKKLLDVASAFALKPEIILLDEPTSGVSTAEKSTIMQVLVQAAKHTGIKAIIQVEHDMDIVFGYSSRIIAVHDGRILADGSAGSDPRAVGRHGDRGREAVTPARGRRSCRRNPEAAKSFAGSASSLPRVSSFAWWAATAPARRRRYAPSWAIWRRAAA